MSALRAYGIVSKDSPYVGYHKEVGFPLIIAGIVTLIASLIAQRESAPMPAGLAQEEPTAHTML